MPFVLHGGDQFRPAAPPTLDSQAYAAALTETQQPDDDQNDGTTADVNWEPLANTPADPSYPGAHSDLGFAAATVLAHQYGDSNRFTVTSSTLPGVNRTFSQFSDAANAAGLSRIYAGVHTRIDHEAGRELGLQIADYELSLASSPAA